MADLLLEVTICDDLDRKILNLVGVVVRKIKQKFNKNSSTNNFVNLNFNITP